MRNASRAVVTHLTIRDPAMFGHLGKYPALKSVRFKGELTLEALKALPPGVEHLEIGRSTGSGVSNAGLALLATRPLKSLSLNGIEIDAEGSAAAGDLRVAHLAQPDRLQHWRPGRHGAGAEPLHRVARPDQKQHPRRGCPGAGGQQRSDVAQPVRQRGRR
ncbi:putative fragment of leucine-rich-repeat type III effector protein [Ralstonia solanacearum K60]|nr:putative fragment of leucine-rich-repeat type III effector protein [Ralstonia solanacearum K60]